MIPKYRESKFQCPHCKTFATQEWFNANEAGITAMQIIDHLYLNYRSNISVTAQEYIMRFLSSVDNNFQDRLYHFVPKKFSVATCASCEEFTLRVNEEIIYPKKNYGSTS